MFNPGAVFAEGRVHLAFRAIPEGYEKVTMKPASAGEPDFGYENYVSYIGHAESADGLDFAVSPTPLISPDCDFDRWGAEDARITTFEGTHLITYTALSEPAFGAEDGVRIGLASTDDFRSVTKHGIVGPMQRDKDAVLFPERVGNKIALLHRIHPDVQIAYFDDLDHLIHHDDRYWQQHMARLDEHVVMRPRPNSWEDKKVGAGPPPIATDDGWLLIYHGVDHHHVYRGGLALLCRDDPQRILARVPFPILEPEREYERVGDVPNVVFPEGAAVIDGMLHVYYGAADKVIGHASASLSDVMALLREHRC